MATEPNFEKVIVVGIDRNENSGVVGPDELILCALHGYTAHEVKEFRRRFKSGLLGPYHIAGQTYKVVRVSASQPRFTMKLES
ncbi:MAG TPA: hypothetical protein VLW25_11085 [Bryobacteraceae bacterium]|nr:hypothetical protein [Bryobacteraceae bacterium]